MTLTYDLDLQLTFDPLRATLITYSHAKVQDQRSVGSEYRVETNGRTARQTDGGDCITSLDNAVGKYSLFKLRKLSHFMPWFLTRVLVDEAVLYMYCPLGTSVPDSHSSAMTYADRVLNRRVGCAHAVLVRCG